MALRKQPSAGSGPFETTAAHPLGHFLQGRGSSDRVTEHAVVALQRVEPGLLVHFQIIQQRFHVLGNRTALATAQLPSGPLQQPQVILQRDRQQPQIGGAAAPT